MNLAAIQEQRRTIVENHARHVEELLSDLVNRLSRGETIPTRLIRETYSFLEESTRGALDEDRPKPGVQFTSVRPVVSPEYNSRTVRGNVE